MKRDGEKQSLWQHGIVDYTPVNKATDEVYDVLIVGGGITGITTALLLQSEGKRCILAEAQNLGFGTTGGTTAHINTMLDTTYAEIEKNFGEDGAKLVYRGAREAMDLIEGLNDRYRIDCDFVYRTAYLYADTHKENEELEKILNASEKAGCVSSWASGIPVPIPFTKAVRFEFQAQFHPIKYIHGLAKAYEAQGGIIRQQCAVTGIKSNDDGVVADTSAGAIRAKQAVYATHIPPGINILHFRNAPYRSYAAAFTLKNGVYPDGLAYDMKDPYHYFRTHVIDGQQYVIGGGFDHKTGHNENTEYVFTELEAYLRKYFDIDTVAYKWSSQYYIPADGLPYIGLMPGEDKIYVATGFGGNGMTLGSLAAKVLCGLLVNRETPYADIFSPTRIKPVAGFANFVKENADVVSAFISRRFSYEKIAALVELAPGDATIAEWEGKKVALYKDDNGRVHALDPVCPHAGCVVAWNNAEKSWDCPCHGGRYSADGALLTGPARKGLERIVLED
ncbi:MAG: FAD-dependent oxidoreductase [Taibaiella sp.]|nr:FAD-dependent oxidoreductase [Taibaiella sp.]